MKFDYGWVIVGTGLLVLTLVVGAAIHAYGLYVLPVSEALGLSRAEMNTGLILLNFGMAIWGALVGRLLDRGSSRMVMAGCSVLFGASLVGLGLSQSLWLSALLLAGPLAIGVVGCGTLTSTVLVARWFTARRGRAMAITAIGISLGPVLVVPLTGQLIEAAGWRQTLIVSGVGISAMLLLLSLLVRDRRAAAEAGQEGPAVVPEAAERPGEVLGVSRIITMASFWTLSLSAALAFGIQQTIIVSMVPFAQGQGLSIAQGASLLSVFGVAAIVGKLVLAGVGDRFDKLGMLAVLFGLLSLAAGTLLIDADYLMLLACSGLIGLAAGCTTPLYLALLADRFGASSFGSVSGTSGFVTTLVGAACIRLGGELFDRTGSYELMFACFVGMGLFSSVLLLSTRFVSPGGEAGPERPKVRSAPR